MLKEINLKKLCMGCMKERHSANEVCPYCGFDEQEYRETQLDCLPPGTELFGKFIVGKMLGNGGFGKTYVAFDKNINLKVCIKELFPAGYVTRGKNNEVSAQRGFEDEFENYKAKAHDETLRLSEFNHLPGVVSVRDYFEENNTAYIVMDFIEGINLREYLLKQNELLSAERVLNAMKPLMETLAQIHDAGVIHRDISPDNLMLTKNGELVLIDFGAAREFSYDTTHTVTTILKHGYAPIEQYSRSGKQGPWTDIYALGATIYRMITGKVLTESTDRAMSKEQPFDGLEDIVDKKTIRALTKALAVDQSKRYRFIENFYRALYGKNIPGYVSVNKLVEQADEFQGNWDYENANKVYFKAAHLGNAKAMFNLGYNYEDGNGVEQDYKKANEWYLKAAELGDSTAMNNLGYNYAEGRGVEQDYEKANEWYLKAAELGESTAMNNLGYNYAEGRGVEQDYEKANEWWLKAAELGDSSAMSYLGYNYAEGCGVKQDYEKAIEWYKEALDAGCDEAKDAIERLQEKRNK